MFSVVSSGRTFPRAKVGRCVSGSLFLRCPSLVMVMKAADFRDLDYLPSVRCLPCSTIRRVHRKRLMNSPRVVVAEVLPQDATEVIFAEHDDVIEAFASNGADETLHIGVLPG